MDEDCHRVQLIPASPTRPWPQEPSSPGVPAHRRADGAVPVMCHPRRYHLLMLLVFNRLSSCYSLFIQAAFHSTVRARQQMFAFSHTVNIVCQGTWCLDDCHLHLLFSTAPRPRSRYSVLQFLLEVADTHRCPSPRGSFRHPCGHSPACPLHLYPRLAPLRDDEQSAQTPAALTGRGCPAPLSLGPPLPPAPSPSSAAARRRGP